MHVNYRHTFFQGGFAKCYELTDVESKEIFAGKIVPKSLLVKQHQKDKVKKNMKILPLGSPGTKGHVRYCHQLSH